MKRISEKDKRLRLVEEQIADILDNMKKAPRTKTINRKQTIIQIPKEEPIKRNDTEDLKMAKKAQHLLALF